MTFSMLSRRAKLFLPCGNIEIKRWHNIKLGKPWRCVKFCRLTKGHRTHAEHTDTQTEHTRIVKTPYTDDTCADTIMYIVHPEEEVLYLYYGLWQEISDTVQSVVTSYNVSNLLMHRPDSSQVIAVCFCTLANFIINWIHGAFNLLLS